MRRFLFFVFLVLVSVEIASTQSTPPGSESENVYLNQTLGITWDLPKDWTTRIEGVSLLGDDYLVLLRILPNAVAGTNGACLLRQN
jgi:hypothetical protein